MKYWTVTKIIMVVVLILYAIVFSCSILSAQSTSTVISPKAFGYKSWREPGSPLPITGNILFDIRLGSDFHLYAWNGSAWIDLALEGPEGPQGIPGLPGAAGANGTNGTDGLPRTIADEGTALAVQTTLNFIGAPVTCINNSGASRTDCMVTAVVGPSSSTANAVATYSGTTGAILNDNPGVTIPTPGNLLLTGTIGLTAFDSTHATIQTGSDRNAEQAVRIVRGDQGASAGLVAHSIQLGGTGATSTTDHMLFFDGARNELTMTGLLGFAAGIAPFANADVVLTRLSAGYLSIDDGRTQNGLGKARAVAFRMMPTASPPVACAAGTEGTQYYDTSHALCVCGASAWINLTPSDGGSCS